MTGPEHYDHAQSLLREQIDPGDDAYALRIVLRAQAHATLAQVAATIDAQHVAARDQLAIAEWREVLS